MGFKNRDLPFFLICFFFLFNFYCLEMDIFRITNDVFQNLTSMLFSIPLSKKWAKITIFKEK